MLIYPSIFTFPLHPLHCWSTSMHPHTDTIILALTWHSHLLIFIFLTLIYCALGINLCYTLQHVSSTKEELKPGRDLIPSSSYFRTTPPIDMAAENEWAGISHTISKVLLSSLWMDLILTFVLMRHVGASWVGNMLAVISWGGWVYASSGFILCTG